MIAHLIGNLVVDDFASSSGQAVIDVHGVGYAVFITHNTYDNLKAQQKSQDKVQVFIETHVREDHIHLFGFPTNDDRTAFRLLSTVQGVGAKVAMAILQELNADKLRAAILSQDTKAFTNAAGVGPKLAKRIIAELNLPDDFAASSASQPSSEASPHYSDVRNDALSALTNLGYDKSKAYQAIETTLKSHDDITTEECIRRALQTLAAS